MKKVFIVIAVLFTSLSQAQNMNNIFLELGGSGGLYTINYERHIINLVSFRAGYGNGGEEFTGIPLLLNAYVKVDETNYLGFGLGTSYLKLDLPFSKDGEDIGRLTFYDDFYWMANLFLKIQTNTGLNFRISFTPFYDHEEEKIQPWGGFAIGYAF